MVVNDRLQTSPIRRSTRLANVALHRGMVYGLVAPGYEMAEIVAANLVDGDRQFSGDGPVDEAQTPGLSTWPRSEITMRRASGARP